MPPADGESNWRGIGALVAVAVVIVGLTFVSHWYGFHGNHRSAIAADLVRVP